MVGAPDARDLVLVEELGDGPLGAGVDLHEEDVADVGEQQQQRLPPQDHLQVFKKFVQLLISSKTHKNMGASVLLISKFKQ